jgi:transposase-like protein
MAKRRYSDEERAACLAALTANGGNLTKTAEQVGVPRKTLEHWVKCERHPEAAKMGELKRGPMADAVELVAWKLLDDLGRPEKIDAATLNQVATAFGIAVDKARLLRGLSTSNVNVRHQPDLSLLSDEELAVLERFAGRTLGPAGDPARAAR